MQDNHDGIDIRSYFQELRSSDVRAVPSFDGMTRRRSSRSLAVRWVPLSLACASLITLVIGFTVLLARDRDGAQKVSYSRWQDFTNWQASTDTLLAESGTEFGTAPSISTDRLLASGTAQDDSQAD